MKEYPFRVTRNASYTEEHEVIVSAASNEDALKIAEAFGNGNINNWPDINRYVIRQRYPQTYETVKVERIEDT